MGRMKAKQKDKAVSVTVTPWHCNVLTLPHYMGQKGFEYSDSTTAARCLNSPQYQVTITHQFSK